MRNSVYLLLCLTLAATCRASTPDQAASPVQAAVERWLDSIHFAQTLKGGIKRAMDAGAPPRPIQDAVLEADNGELQSVVARVFAKYMTTEEANALTAFHSSPAGQSILKRGEASLPARIEPDDLPPDERAALEAFAKTSAARKELFVTTDRAVMREYFDAITRTYLK